MKIYLELEFGSGRLFEYSKTAKEGFEKYESKTGKVSYRQFHAYGVFGILQGVSRRKNDFGEFLSIYLIDKDKNSVYIKLPMYSPGGDFNPYTESLLAQIEGVQIGVGYKFQPYALQAEGSKYKNYGVSIKEADVLEEAIYEDVEKIKKLSFAYYKKDEKGESVLVEGDIPPVEWVKKRDKWTVNAEAKTDFLYEIMMANTEDGAAYVGTGAKTTKKYGNGEDAPVTKEKDPVVEKKTATKKAVAEKIVAPELEDESEDDDDDDLPF